MFFEAFKSLLHHMGSTEQCHRRKHSVELSVKSQDARLQRPDLEGKCWRVELYNPIYTHVTILYTVVFLYTTDLHPDTYIYIYI